MNITYKQLMKKVEAGDARINAWDRNSDCADVTFWNAKGIERREYVDVFGIPDNDETPEGTP